MRIFYVLTKLPKTLLDKAVEKAAGLRSSPFVLGSLASSHENKSPEYLLVRNDAIPWTSRGAGPVGRHDPAGQKAHGGVRSPL